MNPTVVDPVVRWPDAERIAVAVLACPQVAGLHGGRFGEVATYLPGRQVTGVRITPTGVSVHLVARYPISIAQLDTAVRAALAPHVGALPLTVVVGDLVADLPARGGPIGGRPVIDEPATPPLHPPKETFP